MAKVKKIEDIRLPNYFENNETIKTGLISLDKILGGGIKNNEFIQIVSEANVDKTLISTQVGLSFCIQGKKVVYIDTKNNLSRERITNIGLDKYINKQFFYMRESSYKVIEDKLDEFISTNEIDLIIIDTISGMLNPGYLNIEGKKKIKIDNNNNSNYGTRPLSLFIDKYKALSIKYKVSFLILNETRNKIHKTLGTIEKAFGCKNLGYSSNIIIKIARSSYSNLKDIGTVGMGLEFRVEKSNRVNRNTKVPFFLQYEIGCSNSYSIVQALIDSKDIIQNVAYYELSSFNIKAKGMKSLLEVVQEQYSVINKMYSDKIENYYSSLINKVIDEEVKEDMDKN